MADSQNFPIWYLLIIAIIGGLPTTLTALAGLIYAIKARGEAQIVSNEVRTAHESLSAKSDLIKSEVDGKMTKMIDTIADLATSSGQRQSRKTDR